MANEVKLKLAIEGARVVSHEIDGVNTSIGQMASAALTAAKAMAGVFAGFAATQTIGKIISVQREFDVLNSSLITVTGSSAKAAQEFAWIKQFAATTPYQLNEVTGAFVKMKALGLDASQKALASYGNTASAMGKNLNQMIEAVADASTGEFERLKEFGIKAHKQGNDVSLTFQGVTKTIGNNATEITNYLQAIGNNEFASAMATRAATLDGAISNLTDTWDALFLSISTNNTGSLIYDSVTLASAAIKDATGIINAMSSAADSNAKSTGAMATMQEALAVTFETVAVLGVNTKYILTQIGKEVGGLAAQAVQLLQGNFAGAAAIGEAMRTDAAAARKEVDATTAAILLSRQNAASAAEVNAQASARIARQSTDSAAATVKAHTTVADAAKASAEAAKKAAAEHEKAYKQTLDAAQRLANVRNKEYADVENYMAAESLRLVQTANVSEETVRQAQAEYDNHGKLQSEIAATTLVRLQDQLVNKTAGTEAYDSLARQIEAQKNLVDIMRKGEFRDLGEKAADDLRKAQQKAAEESSKYWEYALMRAFESGKGFFQSLWDTIKNTLKTQVLKVAGKGIVGSLGLGAAGAALAGSSGSSDGGSGFGIGDALNAYSLLSDKMSGAITTGFTKLASTSVGQSLGLSETVATVGNNPSAYVASTELTQLGSQIATGLQYVGNAMAGYAAGSFANNLLSNGYSINKDVGRIESAATLIVSAINPLAGAVVGAVSGVVNSAFGSKLVDTGIEGTFGGASGFSGNNYTTEKNGFISSLWNGSQENNTSPMDASVQKNLAAQFRAVQISTALMAQQLGTSADSVSAFTTAVKISFDGLNADQAEKRVKEEISRINETLAKGVLTGMAKQDLGNNTTAAQEYLKGFLRDEETFAQALARMSTSLTSVNAAFDVLGHTLFESTLKGADNASKLVDAFGGLDNFTAKTASYFSSFYSAEEQRLQAIKSIGNSVTAFSIAPLLDDLKTGADSAENLRKRFRLIVESQDLTTASGQAMYAQLLGVSGAFASVTYAAKQAADALKATQTATGNAIKSIVESLDDMRKAASDADANVLSAQADIRSGYMGAQQRVNDLLIEASRAALAFSDSISAFLSTLGAGAGKQSLTSLKAQFSSTATLAGAGDSDSQARLIALAGSVLDGAKTSSRSAVEYARSEAFVRSTLASVQSAIAPSTVLAKTTDTSLSDQIIAAQAEQNVWEQLALDTNTSILKSTDNVAIAAQATADDMTALRASYDAAVVAQTEANLKLGVALAALETLGLTESSLTALVNGQLGGTVASDFATALGVSNDTVTALQTAIGWTDAELQALSDSLNVKVAPAIFASLSESLGVPAETLAALGSAIGVSPVALADIAGVLGTQIAFSAEAKAAAVALAGGLFLDKSALELAHSGLLLGTDALALLDGLHILPDSDITTLANGLTLAKDSTAAALASGLVLEYGSPAELLASGLLLGDDANDWVSTGLTLGTDALALASGLTLQDSVTAKLGNALGLSSNAIAAITGLQGMMSAATSYESLVTSSYTSALGRTGEQQGVDYWLQKLYSGELSMTTFLPAFLKGAKNEDTGAASAYGNRLGLPGFAAGTNYVPYDMTARIHQGEAIIPRAYNPAAGAPQQDNTELVEEIKALRVAVAALQKAADSSAVSNAKTANTLIRVTRDGNALVTTV